MQQRPIIDRPAATGLREIRGQEHLTLCLGGFAWGALEQESARLGVSVEELATFAVLYYLADLDSGRIARRIPKTEPQVADRLTPAPRPGPLSAAREP